MPGAVTNPLSRGCHQLIKEGANLVEGAADIVALLNSDLAIDMRAAESENQHDMFATPEAESSGLRPKFSPAAPSEKTVESNMPHLEGVANVIYQALDVVPTAIDRLVDRTGLSVAEIAQHLILMELKGLVVQTPGGYVRM